MTQTLAVLIKLAERKVEEAEAALSRIRSVIQATMVSMEECTRRANEAFLQSVGGEDLSMMMAAQAFQLRMDQEKARFAEVLKLAEVEEGKLREKLHKVFAEQKRYEMLMEKHKRAVAKKHAKKVQEQLDDISQMREF